MLPDLAKQIETINGRALEDEQQDEIARWQKGRDLAHIVNSPGWDVVLEMLQSYAQNETYRCVNTDPGDKDAVLASHAVAFAASRIYNLFTADVANAINQKTPDFVRAALSRTSPVPPESL